MPTKKLKLIIIGALLGALFLLLPRTIYASEVVINEIMFDPSKVSDTTGEWFELYNPGENEVDIAGWKISDNDTDDHMIVLENPIVVPAYGFLTLCRNGDVNKNGGVACGYVYSSFQLANDEDEIIIKDNNGQEIDRVEYNKTFPIKAGSSIELNNVTVNNSLPDNWHTATTTYGQGDKGTPGAQNSDLPSPSPSPSPEPTPEDSPEPNPSPEPSPSPLPSPAKSPSPKPSPSPTPSPSESPLPEITTTATESGEVLGTTESAKPKNPYLVSIVLSLLGIVLVGGSGLGFYLQSKKV